MGKGRKVKEEDKPTYQCRLLTAARQLEGHLIGKKNLSTPIKTKTPGKKKGAIRLRSPAPPSRAEVVSLVAARHVPPLRLVVVLHGDRPTRLRPIAFHQWLPIPEAVVSAELLPHLWPHPLVEINVILL